MPGWHISGGGGGAGGSGDVVGPAASTDNAVARWDLATGKLLQNSDLTVSDLAAGAITITAGKGTAITLKNTDPDATTGASVAGDPLAITAGNAVASTDTAGAAAGGDVTISAGDAARNASGDANGGNVRIDIGSAVGSGSNGLLVLGPNFGAGFRDSGGNTIEIRVPNSTYFGNLNAGIIAAKRYDGAAGLYVLLDGDSRGILLGADSGIARNAASTVRVTDGSTGIGALLNAVLVEPNTAGSGTPNAIAATESGTVFTNEGATAANYHTLPSAAAGYQFTFIVQDADGIRIVANTDDTIRVIDKVTAAAGYIESTTIGSTVTLVSVNAVEWYAIAIKGTWTDGTFTYDDTSLTTP